MHNSSIVRSYGAVFKGIHKATGKVVAIKIIPVEAELDSLMKEIGILKKCDSDYIVTYYGSYFKDQDLWVSNICIIPSLLLFLL
jgi:serine/threonine protein kinase